ncbi:MAG: TetR/AcrR family transcriptional regulator [Solirubrobacteraceae bacterium]
MDLRLPTDLTRRTAPTSAKRAQVERDVLHAVDTLLQDGVRWSDLSIERIATTAGISRTAFYFYFKDKREVLMRLLEEVGREVYDQSAWLHGTAEGGREMLVAPMRSVHAIYEQHGALLQAVVEVSAVDETIAEVFQAILNMLVMAAIARMSELEAAGEAHPVKPTEATARALVAMTERAFYTWRIRGEEITDEHVDALAEIWVRSVYGSA